MFFAEEIFVEGEKSWSSLRNHDSITSTIFFELRTAVFSAERFGCGRSEERWLFCVKMAVLCHCKSQILSLQQQQKRL
jgi:hypothetical protein